MKSLHGDYLCGKYTQSKKYDFLFGSSRSHLWVNNPTLGEFCFAMIGRADIEGSKSNVAMNACHLKM